MSFGDPSVSLPTDQNSQPIQVLSPVDATTVIGTAATGDDAVVTIPTGATVVEIGFSDTVHWRFGASATSSHKIGMGVGVYKVPTGATQVAFLPISGVSSAIGSVTRLV